MANRDFKDVQSNYREVKDVYLKVAIGATGAPTIDTFSGGYASIARNSAGDYTITMVDGYEDLVDAGFRLLSTTNQEMYFQLDAVGFPSARTVGFRCLTGTTPTDPASGSTLYIKLSLRNSSQK